MISITVALFGFSKQDVATWQGSHKRFQVSHPIQSHSIGFRIILVNDIPIDSTPTQQRSAVQPHFHARPCGHHRNWQQARSWECSWVGVGHQLYHGEVNFHRCSPLYLPFLPKTRRFWLFAQHGPQTCRPLGAVRLGEKSISEQGSMD